MMRRQATGAVLALATLTACASGPSRMHRALDASMERVARTEAYLRSVSGITGTPSRLMRGDGFIYLADISPQLRYLAVTADTARYRSLRSFVANSLMRRDSTGLVPARRLRAGAGFEAAIPYGVRRLSEALATGWQYLGDSASAVMVAQLAPVADGPDRLYSATDRLAVRCVAAELATTSEPALARAMLASAKDFRGGVPVIEESALGMRGIDGDLVVLSCLTRLALSQRDEDATVRSLDRLLDELDQFARRSGRPDPGTGADVLLTLAQVRAAGPKYSSHP